MTQTNNSQSDRGTPSGAALSRAARTLWIILILATLYLCYFHNLDAIGLVGPDEPRYAWIARDMAESGDWVTPRLYGKPWFEKPVLYYWGAAAGFKLFGVSEKAARLPSAICALLATLSTAWLAWRFYGAGTARWLLLLLPATVGMIGFSHAAATDMPFSGMLTIAMVIAASIIGLVPPTGYSIHSPTVSRYTNARRGGVIELLLFGFFLGLAVLAKGPAAILLSGSAVLSWAACTKRWRHAWRCLHPVAIASFCTTALPWYIICAQRNPDFFRVFIIEHNFKRFLTPEFQHIQPFWYYLPIVLIAFLPWILALLFSAGTGIVRLVRGERLSPSSTFLLCWALSCLLFFSISKSKLPGYILPSIPAIALLLARTYDRLTASESRIFLWILMGAGVPATLIGVVLLTTHVRAAPAAAALLIAFGIANMLLCGRENPVIPRLALSPLCVVPILLLLLCLKTLLPHFIVSDPSGKTLAGEIQARNIPVDQIYSLHMQRGMQYSLNFYLHREIQEWNANDPTTGYLLLNSRRCRDYVQPPLVCQTDQMEAHPSGWFLYPIKLQD